MSEKTEQPTQKKLGDARKKGNVSQSKDFSKALLLTAFLVYLLFVTPHLFTRTVDLITMTGKVAYTPFDSALAVLGNMTIEILMEFTIPLVIMVVLVGIFADVMQTGPMIAPEKIKINIQNIDLFKKAQQMFAAKSLIEFLKSILKVILLTGVIYYILRSSLPDIALLPGSPPGLLLNVFTRLLLKMMVAVTIVFLLFGGPDLLLQKLLFLRENKMSKDEVFREYKETEGDPHINSKRKHLHQEMASGEGGVKNATAVVVNPTHVAVALYYEKGQVPLPLVLAKGEEDAAREIVLTAREHNIPIVQNIPVARALLADADVNDYIPDWLIEPVAEFLRTVNELAAQGPVDQSDLD